MIAKEYDKAISDAINYLTNYCCLDTSITVNETISETGRLDLPILSISFNELDEEVCQAVRERDEDKLRILGNYIIDIVKIWESPERLRGDASHMFDVSATKEAIRRRCSTYDNPVNLHYSDNTNPRYIANAEWIKTEGDLILYELLKLEDVILSKSNEILGLALHYGLISFDNPTSEAVEALRPFFVNNNAYYASEFRKGIQGKKGSEFESYLRDQIKTKRLRRPVDFVNSKFAKTVVKYCKVGLKEDMIRVHLRVLK